MIVRLHGDPGGARGRRRAASPVAKPHAKAANYRFLLTANDGEVSGGGADRFRIKIWDAATGGLVYDNQVGDDDDANATTALAGGRITVQAR